MSCGFVKAFGNCICLPTPRVANGWRSIRFWLAVAHHTTLSRGIRFGGVGGSVPLSPENEMIV